MQDPSNFFQYLNWIWDSAHWNIPWIDAAIQEKGNSTFHQFIIQFCTGLLLFSTALKRMRECYLAPLINRVNDKYKALETEKSAYVYDQSEKDICCEFAKDASKALKTFEEKVNEITVQRRLCYLGAFYALLIMCSGLYQVSYLWTLSVLWPFAVIYGKCSLAARAAKKTIWKQREGLATAMRGYHKKLSDNESDMIRDMALPQQKEENKKAEAPTAGTSKTKTQSTKKVAPSKKRKR